MSSVNVNKSTNKVVVTNETAGHVVSSQVTNVVSVVSEGPYLNINGAAKVEGSLVYYDGAQFKADDRWTTSSLTDGGNF